MFKEGAFSIRRILGFMILAIALYPWIVGIIDMIAWVNGTKVSSIDWSDAKVGLKYVWWPMMVSTGYLIIANILEKAE